MNKLFLVIVLFCIALLFTCSEKHHNQEQVIWEKDTIWEEPNGSKKGLKIGQIYTEESTELIKKKHKDSIPKGQEAYRLEMIEKQKVTEFKKTIFSKSIDLNFDKKKDLIVMNIIVRGNQDTVTYFSFYSHQDALMKNTFDFQFEEKIDKIIDITTYIDSTFVITAVLTNSKKVIKKKFKYINDFSFLSIN